jgi:hypothetical protein
LAVGQPGGGVQQPVAQPFRFSSGEVTVEGVQLQPGDQIGGDRGRNTPGLVDRELAGREPARAGVFGATDPVLDAGVGAVAGLKPLQRAGLRVRDEGGVAPAVAFLEQGQLGAGMGPFASTSANCDLGKVPCLRRREDPLP